MADHAKIYGRRPVEEAFAAGQRFEQVWLDHRLTGEFADAVRRLCSKRNVPLKYVPRFQLDKLIAANHQGVVAEVALVEFARPEAVVEAATEGGFLLLLDGVTDVRNFGAIARTAYAAGCRGLVIPQKQRAPVNAAAVKASAGALSHLPVVRVGSLRTFVQLLRERDFRVVVVEGRGKRELESADLFGRPVAFVLGSEGEGVSASVRRVAHATVRLPQATAFDSYNVSVAAGMVAYEFLRQNMGQRWEPGGEGGNDTGAPSGKTSGGPTTADGESPS